MNQSRRMVTVILGITIPINIWILNWNCIFHPTVEDGAPRLFDLLNDPQERVDVAVRHPEVVRAFQNRLEGLHGSPFPIRFKHQPDAGDYMTLKSYFKNRERLARASSDLPITIPYPDVSDDNDPKRGVA